MPIRVQNDLPVKEILEQENIFVMDEYRAAHQDIRPISIGLLNLMPLKEDTELQILRSLSEYASAGRCDICTGDKPCVQKHFNQPYLQIL